MRPDNHLLPAALEPTITVSIPWWLECVALIGIGVCVGVSISHQVYQNSQRATMNAHVGIGGAGVHGMPTPGSFGGLENREEDIAKPASYQVAKAHQPVEVSNE